MRRICMLVLLALGLVASGCVGHAETVEAVETSTPTPSATPVAEVFEFTMQVTPSPTPPPTPVPTATPVPTPSPIPTPVPLVTGEWYQKRNEELARLMVQNGYAASIDEANQRIGKMVLDPNRPMVALTFDDGPTHGVTDAILDALERYNARATFFVVGSRVKGSEDLLRRAVSLGCEIANHTFNHDELAGISYERGLKSVQDTVTAVKEACGYEMRSLRPPTGENAEVIKRIATDTGLALVYWSHSTHDYRIDNEKTIAAYVQYDKQNKRELQNGDIVLLHDLRKPTGKAAEEIIRTLTEQGYQLVTVEELLNLSAGGFVPGGSYKKK